MSSPSPNPVMWGPLPPRASAPPGGRSAAWLRRTLLAAAIVTATLPVLHVGFPVAESVPIDVVIVANLQTAAQVECLDEVAESLAKLPRVHQVRLRLDPVSASQSRTPETWHEPPASPDSLCFADIELDEMAQQRGPRLRLVLLVRPFLDDPGPQSLIDLAAECRRSGISVGVLSPPAETTPGVRIAAPTRSTRLGDDKSYGAFSILLRNLEQLATTGSDEVELKLIAHGAAGAFDPASLGGLPLVVGPTAPSEEIRIDLRPSIDQAGGDPVNPMVFLTEVGRALANRVDTLEAIVTHSRGGETRVVDRQSVRIETETPRSLYVPLAALLSDKRTTGFDPRLPQRNAAAGGRVPWNLIWGHSDEGPGMEVYWPAKRSSPPGHAGKLVTTLPAAASGLEAYRHIVIDASAPRQLSRAFDLTPPATPTTSGPFDFTAVHYFPGMVALPSAISGDEMVSRAEWEAFRNALVAYWKGGGTVMVICAAAEGFDSCPVNAPFAESVKDLLAEFDPGLAEFKFDPEPRRLLLSFDSTEQSATASFPVVPAMANEDQKIPTSTAAARRAVDEQLLAYFGIFGVDAPGQLTYGGRMTIALGLRSDSDVADQEFENLLRHLVPGSEQAFAAMMIGRLASTFVHPSVQAEINGRPVWHSAGVQSSPPRSADFTRPFNPVHGQFEYPDLFRTVTRRLQLSSPPAGWPGGIASPPRLEEGPLVDGMTAARLSQYVRDQFGAAPPAGSPPVAVSMLHAPEFVSGPLLDGGRLTWPVLNLTGKTASRLPMSYLPSTLPGPATVLLLGNSSAGPHQVDKFFQGVDPDRHRFVPLSATRENAASRRLTFMGAGRLIRILEAAVARDLQSLNTRTEPSLLDDVRAAGGAEDAETVDILRRIVHERNRLAIAPPVEPKPGTGWVTLASTWDGTRSVPFVSVAPGPAPAGSGKRGALILAAIDPWYEQDLYELRDTTLNGWIDYSATAAFDDKGMPADDPTVGFRGTNILPGSPLYAGIALTGHRFLPSWPTRFMSDRPHGGSFITLQATAWPELGLKRTPIELKFKKSALTVPPATLDAVRTASPGVQIYELTVNDGVLEESLTLPEPGAVFLISPDTIKAIMASVGVGPGTKVFPQALPPLIELWAKRIDGRDSEASVFVPIAPRRFRHQDQHLYFSSSIAYAAPAVQILDLVLELFTRRPNARIEIAEDGRSVAIVMPNAGVPVPERANLVIRPGVSSDPPVRADEWTVSHELPGRVDIRFEATSSRFGKPLQLEITRPGTTTESFRFILPGPTESGERRGTPFRPGTIPDHAPGVAQLAADSLAITTLPEPLRQWTVDPETELEQWTAPVRGVFLAPLTAQGTEAILSDLEQFVEARSTVPHTRSWWLISLGCFLVSLWLGRGRQQSEVRA